MSTADAVWPGGSPAVVDRVQRSRRVSRADIERFTEIRATAIRCTTTRRLPKGSHFGGIVVQGGVTTAILNAVVAEDLPGPGTVFLNVTWDFRAPVRPKDTITEEVEVADMRHDKPVTRLRTKVVLRRRHHCRGGHRRVLHDATVKPRTRR